MVMEFILLPEMVDGLIFAMENQTTRFLFDAGTGCCIPDECKSDDEEDRYYDIPRWNPAHGFHIMEQFTTQVHNPLLREALREALSQRKGVFRRYKEVLRTAPAIEQEWYRFKDNQMKAAVYEWYNELRTMWGLEKICFEEETEPQLLLQDFIFTEQPAMTLDSAVLQNFISAAAHYDTSADERSRGTEATLMEASMLLGKAWLLYIDTNLETEEMGDNKTEQDNTVILSAYTNDELCAVCVITELHGSASLCIPFLRVIPEYRGLGLGKELLQRALDYAEQHEAQSLLFSDFCTPPHFIAQLERQGFSQQGLFYIYEGLFSAAK